MARTRRRIWARRVDEWQASGLTCRQYATGRGLNPSTLAWWKWRLRRDGELLPRTPSSLSFVELTAESQQPPEVEPAPIRLWVGATALEVPIGFDETTLARVLALLQAAS